ncbi:MAG: histidyl-tRNA synthetase [Parcubacteria group bacterium Gr01-1014_49]|nr:MAG: histidyl-tRNA synthetase [Parcubacteria group bacterium Gr01-1014_49]
MSEPLSSTDPYKGVRDFYPEDWARQEAMFSRIRNTLALSGYEEYNASPLERSELYEAKTSEEIVSEQTYTFTDRGDRRVTLRPEMTPTLARMVAAKRRELSFPLRWFSIGNRFRYERPQKGRLREFYQADIDLIGLPEGEADVEVVRLASTILKSFGAKESDFVIILLDRIATLATRGVGNVMFASSITRGFDYYTGMVFEVYDTDSSNPRALFGGGRFDGLVALFGGAPVPAVGFALGDVTLADFLDTHSLMPKKSAGAPQLYLGTPRMEDIPAAEAFADTLRKEGCRIFVNLSDRALGDQIKDAVRRNIPLFAAYGANETATQTVRMKILATGEEVALAVSELPARLRSGS